jgi:hypothetical protein
LIVTVGTSTVGCGKGGTGVQTTMTGAQAKQRTEQLIQQAAAQLPPGAQLKPTGTTKFAACDDPTDGGPQGRVFAELHYDVIYPQPNMLQQAIPQLATYWQSQGYRIKKDMRDNREFARLGVEDPADEFYVEIVVYHRNGGQIDAQLVGSSPCIWENGTPAVR